MDIKKIGFIGFGEAASTFAGGIRKNHSEISIFAFDESNSDRIQMLAAKSNIVLVPDLKTLIESSEVILSLVPGKVAIKVAENVSAYISKEQLYIDFNSVSPQTKKRVAEALIGKGIHAIDGTVMGSVPELGMIVPILLAGENATEADFALKFLGFNSSVVNSNVGDAAAIKMVRSVFMKGIECLFIEMLLSGKKYGVMDYVVESISKSINGKDIKDIMNTLVLSQVYHSARKESEMDYVIEVLNTVGVSPRMSTASRDTFKWLAGLNLKQMINPDDSTYTDIVELVERMDEGNHSGKHDLGKE